MCYPLRYPATCGPKSSGAFSHDFPGGEVKAVSPSRQAAVRKDLPPEAT